MFLRSEHFCHLWREISRRLQNKQTNQSRLRARNPEGLCQRRTFFLLFFFLVWGGNFTIHDVHLRPFRTLQPELSIWNVPLVAFSCIWSDIYGFVSSILDEIRRKRESLRLFFHTKSVCWSCEIVQEVDSRYQTSGIIVLMEGCVRDDDDGGVHYHLTHVTSAPPSSQRYTFFCKTVLVYSNKKKKKWFEICNNKRKIIHNCAVMTDF